MSDLLKTNIEVRMTIPSQTYMACAQEIMGQYSDVVTEALMDIRKDLMFNKRFQEEVKNEVRKQIQESVENAIKSAARKVVWDMYCKNDVDIEKIVTDAILASKKEMTDEQTE